MKKFFAMLLVCMLLVTATLPVTAFATENDGFVDSVHQEGDPNASPKTGDAMDLVSVAGAVIFAFAAGSFFAAADEKKKI